MIPFYFDHFNRITKDPLRVGISVLQTFQKIIVLILGRFYLPVQTCILILGFWR